MRDLSQPTTRSLGDVSERAIQQPTTRNMADDNDEIREIEPVGGKGYPYTYPFYYAGDDPRDLSDTS